jgi:hypothetical protein
MYYIDLQLKNLNNLLFQTQIQILWIQTKCVKLNYIMIYLNTNSLLNIMIVFLINQNTFI